VGVDIDVDGVLVVDPGLEVDVTRGIEVVVVANVVVGEGIVDSN